MIHVTAEAAAWLYVAIQEEMRCWKYSEFAVSPHHVSYYATRLPPTPVAPTKATDPMQETIEREAFDNRESRSFYVQCVAIQKALQALFNDPKVGELLPMEQPK